MGRSSSTEQWSTERSLCCPACSPSSKAEPDCLSARTQGRSASTPLLQRPGLLSDGTVVRLNSSTTIQVAGGQTVTIRDLKPGDELVVHLRQPVSVASTQTIMPAETVTPTTVAPAWQGYRAVIDADQVVVIRYPEGR
jgi:hypothetical protein